MNRPSPLTESADEQRLNPYASPATPGAAQSLAAPLPLSAFKLNAILIANAVIAACGATIAIGINSFGRDEMQQSLGLFYPPLAAIGMLSLPALIAGLGHVCFLAGFGLIRDRRLWAWACINLPFVVLNGCAVYLLVRR